MGIILKGILNKYNGMLDSSGSVKGQVAGSNEYGHEAWGYIEGGELLDRGSGRADSF